MAMRRGNRGWGRAPNANSWIRPCFVVVNLSDEGIADFEVLWDVAMVTNFRTKFAVTGFVWTTATRLIVMEGVWVVGRCPVTKGYCQGNHFWLYMWGAHSRHMANTTEPFVCGSDIAFHFLLSRIAVLPTYVDAAYCYRRSSVLLPALPTSYFWSQVRTIPTQIVKCNVNNNISDVQLGLFRQNLYNSDWQK